MRFKILLLSGLLLVAGSIFAKQVSIIRWPAEMVELDVQFDLAKHQIKGVAKITVPKKGEDEIGILLDKRLKIDKANIGGFQAIFDKTTRYDPTEISPLYGAYGKWDELGAYYYTTALSKEAKKAKPLVIEIYFSGNLYTAPDNRQFSREKVASEVSATIGSEGIYLASTCCWFPRVPDSPCPYTVKATLPKGWNCVTDGKPTTVNKTDKNSVVIHESTTASDGLAFSAGPFEVKTLDYHGVSLMTYFLPEQASLSAEYLEACKTYVDMYEIQLGKYPFPKFAIVDNFLPSGYGMPGWTLLGSEVLKLPFIKHTSLGHEYVHNWFGNSLFVDYREGNWCEGLTAYMADYQFKRNSDSLAGVAYLRDQLRDYSSYVSQNKDYPLKEFVARENQADRAIGYGKGMMVFHMLRQMCDMQDSTVFMDALRTIYQKYQWQPVSWTNLRDNFQFKTRNKLDWFIEQWVNQPGAIKIRLENVNVWENPDYYEWTADFEVITESPAGQKPYRYFLPVRALIEEGGKVSSMTYIEEPRQKVRLAGPGTLSRIELDPGYDVFRYVYDEEAPLAFAKFMGDPEGILVVPSKDPKAAKWKEVAEGLKTEGQTVITDDKFDRTMKTKSVWLFGDPRNNKVWLDFVGDPANFEYKKMLTDTYGDKGVDGMKIKDSTFTGTKLTGTMIIPNPLAEGKTMVLTLGLPEADPVAGTRKIMHYGKYSILVFDGDTNIFKKEGDMIGSSPVSYQHESMYEDEE